MFWLNTKWYITPPIKELKRLQSSIDWNCINCNNSLCHLRHTVCKSGDVKEITPYWCFGYCSICHLYISGIGTDIMFCTTKKKFYNTSIERGDLYISLFATHCVVGDLEPGEGIIVL